MSGSFSDSSPIFLCLASEIALINYNYKIIKRRGVRHLTRSPKKDGKKRQLSRQSKLYNKLHEKKLKN
jgi:hypothetical protein